MNDFSNCKCENSILKKFNSPFSINITFKINRFASFLFLKNIVDKGQSCLLRRGLLNNKYKPQ